MADTIGIVFSGGGIRSACYSAGILEEIVCDDNHTYNHFRISCVSGGGYLGSGFCHRIANEEKANLKSGASTDINYLRKNSIYKIISNLKSKPGYLFDFSSLVCVWHCFRFVLLLAAYLAFLLLKLVPFSFLICQSLIQIEHTSSKWKLVSVLICIIVGIFFKGISSIICCCCTKKSKYYFAIKRVINFFKLVSFISSFTATMMISTFLNEQIEFKVSDLAQDLVGYGIWVSFAISFIIGWGFRPKGGEIFTNSLGWLSFIYFSGWVTMWKINGNDKPSDLVFIKYADKTYNIFLIVSIFILIGYELLSIFYDGLLKYYYAKSITNIFYTYHSETNNGKQKSWSESLSDFHLSLKRFFLLPDTTFQNQTDHTNYIANMKYNCWIKDESHDGIISIGRFVGSATSFKSWAKVNSRWVACDEIEQSTEGKKFDNFKLCNAMSSSAAAVAPNSLLSVSLNNALKIFNICQGEWYSSRKLFFRVIRGSIYGLLAFLPTLVTFWFDYKPLFFISYSWLVLFIFSISGDISGKSDWFIDWSPINWALIRDLRHVLDIPIVLKKLGQVYLTDGGHIENTGLIAMLESFESISTIYMADGSEDRKRLCKDLKKALKIGNDLGWSFSSVKENVVNPDINNTISNFSISNDRVITIIATKKVINETVNKTIYFMKPVFPSEDEIKGKVDPKGLYGFCCGFCFDNKCCSCLTCGKFPNTKTGMQLFYPKMAKAYIEEGKRAYIKVKEDEDTKIP